MGGVISGNYPNLYDQDTGEQIGYVGADGKERFGAISFGSSLIIENLLDKEFVSEIGKTQIVGTLTTDDNNQSVTIDCPNTGRVFLALFSTAYTFLAGHIYCLSFKVTNLVKPTSGGNFLEISGTAPTLDFGSTAIALSAMSSDGTYGIIFQPTTSQAISWRLGFGPGGAVTGNCGCIISEIMVVDLTASSLSVPPPISCGGKQSISSNVDYSAALSSQTSGKLTVFNKKFIGNNTRSLAIFGDSWSNDDVDYPARLRLLLNPKIAVWTQRQITAGVTVAGTRPVIFLSAFESKMQSLINGNTKPAFVLIQSSVNTINVTGSTLQDSQIAEDTSAIERCAFWATSKRIIPILTLTQPVKLGIATWVSDNKYFAAQKQDQIIRSIAARAGGIVFDFKESVGDVADIWNLAAAYNSGDNIHPNQSGADVIAANLQKLLNSRL